MTGGLVHVLTTRRCEPFTNLFWTVCEGFASFAWIKVLPDDGWLILTESPTPANLRAGRRQVACRMPNDPKAKNRTPYATPGSRRDQDPTRLDNLVRGVS